MCPNIGNGTTSNHLTGDRISSHDLRRWFIDVAATDEDVMMTDAQRRRLTNHTGERDAHDGYLRSTRIETLVKPMERVVDVLYRMATEPTQLDSNVVPFTVETNQDTANSL